MSATFCLNGRLAGTFHIWEGTNACGNGFRDSVKLERDFGDHAKGAFGTYHQPGQIIAGGRFLGPAGGSDDFAIRHDGCNGQHVLAHGTVANGVGAGRACCSHAANGRVGPGVCLRLYSEEDYAARPEYTDPEIRRTNLASVILQMLQLGLGDVEKFPFIDPPDGRMVRDGYKLLEELGAVTSSGKLTGTGRRMARFPVDPKLARMVLEAQHQACLQEVLVIVSALSVQDPRERPAGDAPPRRGPR